LINNQNLTSAPQLTATFWDRNGTGVEPYVYLQDPKHAIQEYTYFNTTQNWEIHPESISPGFGKGDASTPIAVSVFTPTQNDEQDLSVKFEKSGKLYGFRCGAVTAWGHDAILNNMNLDMAKNGAVASVASGTNIYTVYLTSNNTLAYIYFDGMKTQYGNSTLLNVTDVGSSAIALATAGGKLRLYLQKMTTGELVEHVSEVVNANTTVWN
jgi:hypothetical protein